MAFLVAATTTCVVLLRLIPGEEVSSHYPNFVAALEGDAVQRGWLPPFTPPTAVGIRIWANLDVNSFAVSFRVSAAESASFLQVLRDSGFTAYAGSAPREPAVFSDWRAADGIPPPPKTAPVLEGLHHAGGARVLVVVDTKNGLVYYWHR